MRGRIASVLLLILAAGLCVWAQTAPQASQPHPSRQTQTQATAGPGTAAPMASEFNPRVQKLSSQLLCMCGCTEILNQCNHQGTDRCLTHDNMMAELRRRVAGGESDSLILQSFVQEYGPQVLVVPPARGFDLTAWLMPIFVSLAGLTLAVVVVQRWRERGAKPVPAASAGPGTQEVRPDLLERARAETRDEDYT